jgi:hypothetical protein
MNNYLAKQRAEKREEEQRERGRGMERKVEREWILLAAFTVIGRVRFKGLQLGNLPI